MKSQQFDYVMDKETKGTFRFKPLDEDKLGNATIYLSKKFCEDAEIDSQKGFTLTVTPK